MWMSKKTFQSPDTNSRENSCAARDRLLSRCWCGLERQGRPGCAGVGRAVEAAPVRAGVEDARIARAHGEGTDVQRGQSVVGRRPGLSAVETFPDSSGPSDIECLWLGWIEEDTADEQIGERLPYSLPLFSTRRSAEEALRGSCIDDVRVDDIEDNGIDPQGHRPHQFLFGNESVVDFLPPHRGAVGPID